MSVYFSQGLCKKTNTLAKLFGFCLLLTSTFTTAGAPRQECLGRLIFEAQENLEWATFNADRTMQISKGGGHGFGLKVGADGDYATYGELGAVIYVSDEVDRSMLDDVYGYRRGTSVLHQDYLKEKLKTTRSIVKDLVVVY